VEAMLHLALNPPVAAAALPVTEAWRSQAAYQVIAALEKHRATWQYWHLWAETQRQLRGAAIDPADTTSVTAAVIEEAIARSVPLAGADDQAELLDYLRRTDGASVFTIAGSDQYTSPRILAAEQRLLAAALQTDGRTLDPAAVLDAGQAAMVRTLAADPSRLQLVIAPAGAGKTTALRVLANTWTGGGGHVLGLAPSATAAAQLTDATGIQTDTLARLTWAIQHHQPLPEWADQIGPRTLLLIDEAGMADTLTLDTAVHHVLDRGGRVCLVGDDRQLGAVGAGRNPHQPGRGVRIGSAH
jgi:AAA domain